MKKYLFALGCLLLAGAGCAEIAPTDDGVDLASFRECVEAGYPVAESYPRTCRAGGETFTEDIGNVLEKNDKIRVASPAPNTEVTSPLAIVGEARGTWYFEATFPVRVEDANGNTIANGYATAADDWMTEDFVPFTATVTFASPATGEGKLILERSNASGLPEHDDELSFPIWF